MTVFLQSFQRVLVKITVTRAMSLYVIAESITNS